MHAYAELQNLPPLIRSLCRPDVWPHPVAEIRVVQTHVSWVILTGDFAYKIKRPLSLGFLDFSTLERRRQACEQELELNRRFAPGLYLSVVAIAGSPSDPVIANAATADDEAIEYAVRMREFPQENQLDRQLQTGSLELADMDALAANIAAIHDGSPVAAMDDGRGTAEAIVSPALANFAELEPLIDDAGDRKTLTRLREWTTTQAAALAPRMEQRRAGGYVREGHGDLHLSNLTRFEDRIVPFDCIEFDPSLRWRDVMSEVGFVVMDFAARQRVDLAWRFLNRYLEQTGDYPGCALLRFYIVYATLVRAKIAALRAEQEPPGSAIYADAARHFRMHLALAERAVRPRHAAVFLTTGLSGSGKTWLTSRLCTVLPAIRIRSDIERKRLHGLKPDDRSDSAVDAGLYTESATEKTYEHLRACARDLLTARLDVIVDAAFLKRRQRELFLELARETDAAMIILDCHADESILRERVTQRAWDGADASEADRDVLAHQLTACEPLNQEEQALSITVDTSGTTDPLRVAGDIWRKLGRETAD